MIFQTIKNWRFYFFWYLSLFLYFYFGSVIMHWIFIPTYFSVVIVNVVLLGFIWIIYGWADFFDKRLRKKAEKKMESLANVDQWLNDCEDGILNSIPPKSTKDLTIFGWKIRPIQTQLVEYEKPRGILEIIIPCFYPQAGNDCVRYALAAARALLKNCVPSRKDINQVIASVDKVYPEFSKLGLGGNQLYPILINLEAKLLWQDELILEKPGEFLSAWEWEGQIFLYLRYNALFTPDLVNKIIEFARLQFEQRGTLTMIMFFSIKPLLSNKMVSHAVTLHVATTDDDSDFKIYIIDSGLNAQSVNNIMFDYYNLGTQDNKKTVSMIIAKLCEVLSCAQQEKK